MIKEQGKPQQQRLTILTRSLEPLLGTESSRSRQESLNTRKSSSNPLVLFLFNTSKTLFFIQSSTIFFYKGPEPFLGGGSSCSQYFIQSRVITPRCRTIVSCDFYKLRKTTRKDSRGSIQKTLKGSKVNSPVWNAGRDDDRL